MAIRSGRDEVEQARKEIEREYPVSISIKTHHISGFTGLEVWTAIIAFIFGGVAAGFFSSIGEDLWTKAKDLCKKIPGLGSGGFGKTSSCVFVAVVHKGYQIVALLEVDSESRHNLESVYAGSFVEVFWESLPAQLSTVLKMIDEGAEYITTAPIEAVSLTLDMEKPGWVLSRYKEKMEIEGYLKTKRNGLGRSGVSDPNNSRPQQRSLPAAPTPKAAKISRRKTKAKRKT